MKFSITFKTDYDFKSVCKKLSAVCRCRSGCPVGLLLCPFGRGKDCYEVTAADWAKNIKEVKE